MPSDPRSNLLLASLSGPDFELVRPLLRAAPLNDGVVLVEAGSAVAQVYFPHSGILSLVVRLAGGEAVESAMVGRDGVFGAAAALEGEPALATAVVQLAGKASTLDAIWLRDLGGQSATLRASLVRYEQTVYSQVFQSVACNARHSARSRLSRWLLRARDLTDSDTLLFSQEALAQMLGAHRNSVSIVASLLREAGLIRYSRGQIEIIDIEGLGRSSCECHRALRLRTSASAGKG